jgi:tetratricopeptide (TPR) repeat protein
MPRLLRSLASAFLLTAAALFVGSTAVAQSASRVVVLPFDASGSVDALGLATASALQRALNQIDGVYVPPVGDALVVLQRATQAGVDPLVEIERLFGAEVMVLGRIAGTGALEVELVVSVAGVERSETVRGSVNDVAALWRQLAERIVALAELRAGGSDVVEIRQVLASAPEIAVLGPLGTAAARLPGVRLDDLETALSLDPRDPWLLAETARVAALQGRLERAVELVRLAAAAAPEGVEVRATEGIVRAAAGDAEGARAAFGAALARNPSHAIALTGLAELATDATERLTLLERALGASPRLLDAHLALASLQTTPQRQLQVLRRGVDRLPDSATMQRALVETVLAAGDTRGALELLRQSAQSPMAASPSLYGLAVLLPASIGGDALAFLREGRQRFPASASLALGEAELLVVAGDVEAAEGVLRAFLAEQPAATAVAEALSSVLARQGRVDEARDVLAALDDRSGDLELRVVELQLAAGRARLALQELEPRIAAGEGGLPARTLYGIALGRVGRFDEATTVLTQVLAEAPDFAAAERALRALEEQRLVAGEADLALQGEAAEAFEQGLHALELGEFGAAAAAFGRARSFGDAGLLAFYEGFALQNHGDVRGAISAYTAARAELGDNDVLLNNLGFAQLQVGRIDLALDALRAAVAANDRNPQALLNLGFTHYQLGQFDEALRRFEQAIALAPELEEAAGPFVEDARRRRTP